MAACMDQNITNVLGSVFGQPMAQIYYDSLGKSGALGFMSVVAIVQFFMGLSIVCFLVISILKSACANHTHDNSWLQHLVKRKTTGGLIFIFKY